MVMPIPDSGTYAALGYAEESHIPLEMGFVRNHYIGRTFIQPTQFLREFRVRVKINPIRDVIKGKSVVVVEDSIVRGTTSRSRIDELREAGAKEIHMRIYCPHIKYPCFYGIDFHCASELIANKYASLDKIRQRLGVDSLGYLSLEGMQGCFKYPRNYYCATCWTGKYPLRAEKRHGITDGALPDINMHLDPFRRQDVFLNHTA